MTKGKDMRRAGEKAMAVDLLHAVQWILDLTTKFVNSKTD